MFSSSRQIVIALLAFTGTLHSTALGRDPVLQPETRPLQHAKPAIRVGFAKVSELSLSEKVRLLGAPLSDVRTDGRYGQSSQALESVFPETFDWRNKDGVDYVSPVKNQGRCGSCVAFAAATAFETQLNIATGSVLHGWDFSTQHLFSCGGGSCSSGWFPGSAAQYLVKKGVPEFACYPYVSGALGQDSACRKTCDDAKVRSQKATLRARSQVFRGASVDDVKTALLEGPLMTTMRVYDDFYLYSGGVYRHREGALLGGHAVVIVGWSQAERAWIARNSWGTDWGEKGDFKIAWDDVSGVGGSFWGFEANPDVSAIVLEGVKSAQTIREPIAVSARFHNLNVASAQLEFARAGQALHTIPMTGSGHFQIDPDAFEEGAYTIQIRARVHQGEVVIEKISQAKLIYILRSKPTATIQIERMKAGMNVWETIVPVFAVTSSPVPLGAVQYRLIAADGQEVRRRRTDHTAERVGMSLSPRGLPVGRYTLVAEALSSDDVVLASTSLEFNFTER